MSSERRVHPRIQCRLACAVKMGRAHVRGRVLDLSEGGLCILLPDRVTPGLKLQVTIEVPRIGSIPLETTVWHQRRVRDGASAKGGWATGLLLDKAAPGYETLVNPASLLGLPVSLTEAQPNEVTGTDGREDSETEGPPVFRLRLKAVGGVRTRTLTLSAPSPQAAEEAVVRDLPGEWSVLDIELQ